LLLLRRAAIAPSEPSPAFLLCGGEATTLSLE
jgi:hypothetical protein